jgi:hypothetical protein
MYLEMSDWGDVIDAEIALVADPGDFIVWDV